MNGNGNILELRHVSKLFTLESGSELRVLNDIDFSIRENEVVALVGPSGSGKSTCLRIIAGILEPSSGEVFVKGAHLQGINPSASLVFQLFALFPWLSTYDNIALALQPLGLAPKEIKDRVRKAIDLVGLEGFEEAYPRELSGGMKQRVGFARALVMDRPLLLLDEPFSALDVLTAETLRAEVQKIMLNHQTATKAILLVTHNIVEAVFLAHRIMIMGTNPGHVRQEIRNDLPFPRDDQSPAFQRTVSKLHELITEVLLPDVPVAPPVATLVPGEPSSAEFYPETLPNVAITEVMGLLEAVADKGGRTNIFDLALRTGKEFGRTLYLVKAAEIFDLVDTPKQDIILTDSGKRFVSGDINVRKQMLHDLFPSLHIVQMVTTMLRIQSGLKMPIDELSVCFQEWLPNENPNEVIQALIGWGRFAEYFGYNDDTKEFYLDVGQDK